MTCSCGSNRFLHVGGKSSDLNNTSVPHLDLEKDGYIPHINGIGGGDYYEITVCCNCSKLQDFGPMTDDQLKEALDN